MQALDFSNINVYTYIRRIRLFWRTKEVEKKPIRIVLDVKSSAVVAVEGLEPGAEIDW